MKLKTLPFFGWRFF